MIDFEEHGAEAAPMLAGFNHGTKPMVRGGIQCANERHSMRRGGRVRDVAERVKKIVAEHLGVDKAKVTENAIFIEDLGADSLEAAELVIAFEEEFGCEIPEEAVEQIVTVQDAINFIETHSHQLGAGAKPRPHGPFG